MKSVGGVFASMTQARKALEQVSAKGLTAQIIAGTDSPAGIKREIAREVGGESLPVEPRQQPPTGPGGLGLAGSLPGVLPLVPPEYGQGAPFNAGGETVDQPLHQAPIVDPGTNTLPGGVHEALSGYGFSSTDIQDIEAQLRNGSQLVAIDLLGDMGEQAVNLLSQAGASQIYIGTRFVAMR